LETLSSKILNLTLDIFILGKVTGKNDIVSTHNLPCVENLQLSVGKLQLPAT